MKLKAWFSVLASLFVDRLSKSIAISSGSFVAWNDGFLGGSVSYGTENFSVPFSLIIIACVFCYFVLLLKFVKNQMLLISSGAFLGGMLSNLLDRILYHGVVADPIQLSNSVSTNVADIVQFISMGAVVCFVIRDTYLIKKTDQRLNLFRNSQQQTKIFLETTLITSVIVLLFTGIHYFTLDSLIILKLDLITGFLIVPLAGLFLALLSNTRYGAIKSLERHLIELKRNPGVQFIPRKEDDHAEIKRLHQLITDLLQK